MAGELREQVLGVVEQEQEPLAGKSGSGLYEVAPGLADKSQRLCNLVQHKPRLAQWCERDPPDAVNELV
jgi:hypothetical protein